MGHLLADAYLEYCGDCDVAIVNSGTIRASISSSLRNGSIVYGDVNAVLPFQSVACTGYIKGEDLAKALQAGVAFGKDSGAIPVTGNLRFSWNPAVSDITKRLIEVQVWSTKLRAYRPLDTLATYKFVTNNYLLAGGDGYTALTKATGTQTAGPTEARIVSDFIIKNSPVSYPTMDEIKADCLKTIRYLSDSSSSSSSSISCRMSFTSLLVEDVDLCPSNRETCVGRLSPWLDPTGSGGGTLSDGLAWVASEFLSSPPDCTTCSGLGKCSASRTCQCFQPKQGMLAGMEWIRGADCSDIRSLWVVPASAKQGMVALAAIAIFCCCSLSILLIVFRDHSHIRSSNIFFGHTSALGGVLLAACIIIDTLPRSDTTCQLRVWLLALGFAIMFGSTIAKTWGLLAIFSHVGAAVKDWRSQMQRVLGLIVGGEVLILTVFQIIAPLRAEAIAVGDAASWEATMSCGSSQSTIFLIVAIIYNAAIIAWNLYLIVQTRDVRLSSFNDTRTLALGVYNITILCLTILPTVFVLAQRSPYFTWLIQNLVIAYVCIFNVATVYVPRFWRVWKPSTQNQFDFGVGPAVTHHTTGCRASSSHAVDLEQLQREFEDLRDKIVNAQMSKLAGLDGKKKIVSEKLQQQQQARGKAGGPVIRVAPIHPETNRQN